MIKRISALFAGLAVVLSVGLAGGSPVYAGTPGITWEHVPTLTQEQMTNVELLGQAAQGAGWEYKPVAKKNDPWCDSTSFCMWVDIEFGGKKWQFTTAYINSLPNYSMDLRTSSCGAPNCIDNTGSSWANYTPNTMYLFDDFDCRYLSPYWWRWLDPGNTATAQGSDWNDRVSAFGWNIRSNLPC